MNNFNKITSKKDLATNLDIPVNILNCILYVKKTESYYKSFDIPKKNNSIRRINASKKELKIIQSKLANRLSSFTNISKFKNISHAFEKDKGIITNAEIHRNKRFILSLDLEDFFDKFHFGRIRGFFAKNKNFQLPMEVATIIAQLTSYKGCLPQGAPTSPIISNLIFSILDTRIVNISRKFKINYTRYADDMTFSTNDKEFINKKDLFLKKITTEIKKFGFSVNNDKTRIAFRDSRQIVTGLIVNKKINIKKDYYKNTRAMADSLYRNGKFEINGSEGTIRQLEGRLSFINQLDYYNRKNSHFKNDIVKFNAREKEYRKFLFYKYFFANSKPLIVTEGKTDILYLKAALKANWENYPQLISKENENFKFKISFLRRTKRLKFFLKLHIDGADAISNIYKHYIGIKASNREEEFPNIYKEISSKSEGKTPLNPVILIFDNEQIKDKPITKFKHLAKIKSKIDEILYIRIINNLYLLTHSLLEDVKEAEIESLFNVSFDKNGNCFYEGKQFFSKDIFSNYVYKNYDSIDFSNFKQILDDINNIVIDYENAIK